MIPLHNVQIRPGPVQLLRPCVRCTQRLVAGNQSIGGSLVVRFGLQRVEINAASTVVLTMERLLVSGAGGKTGPDAPPFPMIQPVIIAPALML